MTNKQQFWKKHITAWEDSSLSQAGYCRKHGLAVKTFGYHKRRMAAASKPQLGVPVPPNVLPTENKSQVCTPIRLCVSGGFWIEIEPDFCQQTLKRLLDVVA